MLISTSSNRTGTCGSEHSLDRRLSSLSYRKKTSAHQDNAPFSSSESLGGRSSVPGRQTPVVIPEQTPTNEVRVIRPVKGQPFRERDERLVIVSTARIPIIVFSSLPYNKSCRTGRLDHPRRVDTDRGWTTAIISFVFQDGNKERRWAKEEYIGSQTAVVHSRRFRSVVPPGAGTRSGRTGSLVRPAIGTIQTQFPGAKVLFHGLRIHRCLRSETSLGRQVMTN